MSGAFRTEAHAIQKPYKAWIGPQAVKNWFDSDEVDLWIARLRGHFQPSDRLRAIAERCRAPRSIGLWGHRR